MTICYNRDINLLDFLPKVNRQIGIIWPYYLCYALEIVFLLADIILACFLLKLLATTVVWHNNLTYIASLFVSIQIPAHFGRMVFIGYAIVYDFKNHCDLVLITASCSQMLYIFVLAHSSAGFMAERFFALYHLKDYERRNRRYISLSIILFIITTGVYFVYLNTMGEAVEKFAFYVIGIIFTNIVLFFVIIRWNKKMIFRVSLSGKPQNYSLNKRFQLVENVRVLTLCKNTALIASLWIIAVCCLLVYMDYFGWNPQGLIMFELLKSSGPSVVMLTVIVSMPKWKEELYRVVKKTQTRVYVQELRRDEAELYFGQLSIAWNAPK